MTTYKVFNENNVLKKVSDADLDAAARASGPLPTELAHAAALAKRRDLAGRLLETLGMGPRLQRLTAAKALLALEHADAAPALEALAQREADGVIASMFRAIALRLRGVAALRSAWEREDDPELCAIIPSMYNSRLALNAADVEFMISMLNSYIDMDRAWIKACSKDEWRNAVAILVDRIAADAAKSLRQSLDAALQDRLRDVLERITASAAERETKLAAKRALQELPAV